MAQESDRSSSSTTYPVGGAIIVALVWVLVGLVLLVIDSDWLVPFALVLGPPVILVFLGRLLREAAALRAGQSALGTNTGTASIPQTTRSPAPIRPAPPISAVPGRASPAAEAPPTPPLPEVQNANGNEGEPGLGLAAPAEEPPLANADLVRALHFPEDNSDAEGFAALRRALGHHRARQLIQAAQDMLTLMSQDGIYTDDLVLDHTRPEVWRRFAQGERGHPVAQLGQIHDRAALGIIMARMREDTIFRDSSHHFLRLFDRVLSDFEPDATDEELIALSMTRTSRAFMLIGRAMGVFG